VATSLAAWHRHPLVDVNQQRELFYVNESLGVRTLVQTKVLIRIQNEAGPPGKLADSERCHVSSRKTRFTSTGSITSARSQ
jgi:hypothetical protein